MTEERPDDQLPEHERRRETDIGGGLAGEGGTAPETGADRRAADAGFIEDPEQPTSDVGDPDPEDPDGPEVAFPPRSI